MLMTRAQIPKIAYFYLSKGIIIITRYSLVRKQFKDNSGN
jgi:hypothetical protein